MDKKTIIEETDAETVAEFLQMEIVHKGKYAYISCPGHRERLGKPDTNIGNAVLKRKGYMCYACNTFVNTHDMVMEVTGCSFDEAYNIMAKAMGFDLCDHNVSDNENVFPKLRLSKEEAEIIGLYPRFREIAVQKSNRNGAITLYDGLFELYQKNPDMYFKIIVEKALEAKRKYSFCKEHYASITADTAYAVCDLLGETFDSSIYGKIDRELEKRLHICTKIISIFSTRHM